MDSIDLGLDLVTAHATCAACRKQSDGAKTCGDGTVLCGTHFDEFLATLFPNHVDHARKETPAAFAKRLREGPFASCWAAELEGA